MTEEEVDLGATGEALHGSPLACGGPVPVATGSRRPDGKRAAVGEAAQAAKVEACSGRQVVQAVAEPHGPRRGSAGAGVGERLAVVVVSVDEQKLEARAAEQGSGGAEEAASFRVAWQEVEVAEREERVAALFDGALDQAAQVRSIAVQVTENEQPAHAPSLPRTCSLVPFVAALAAVVRPAALRPELGPGVLEAERAVEDEPLRRRVGIRAEIAEALELHGLTNRQLGERRLDHGFLEHRFRVGVDVSEGVAVGVGVGAGKESVIETHVGGHSVLGREPVQSRLGPTPVGRVAAARLRIVGAAELDDLAACVLDNVGAGHEVGVAETHLAARGEAKELPRRVLHEIVTLDPELAREGHLGVPAEGSSGLLTASSSSTCPSG